MKTARESNGEVQFSVTTRPATPGMTEVVLRLYRHDRFASETVIAKVPDKQARTISLMSRIELFHLGCEERDLTSSHVDPPQAKKDWTSERREPLVVRPAPTSRGGPLAGTLTRLPFRRRNPSGLGSSLRKLSAAASNLRYSIKTTDGD
jgi:hypothetical protein